MKQNFKNYSFRVYHTIKKKWTNQKNVKMKKYYTEYTKKLEEKLLLKNKNYNIMATWYNMKDMDTDK